jgi:cobyrinic acid a,c-diamide synthase
MTSGLIVAAPHSGAGKTTVTIGLMRALCRQGLAVQAFKCGPDYIDPAFHAAATGRPSFNLDTWAMAETTLGNLVARHAADIAIAEGVMGLFDGVAAAGQTARGATADLAALLGWPVLLVLDVSGQTETAAAVAAGLAQYRDDVDVAGVILNRVASPRHLALITPGFERVRLKVFGALGHDTRFELPERHLGLVQADETDDIDRRLDALADAIASAVDLAAVRRAAAPAKPMTGGTSRRPPGQRIALARDRAFSFMYPHLLEDWRSAGAEILPFSPLADEAPDQRADVVWLPGGYPELHGGVLAAARRFQDGLHVLAARSVPIHGECGGYMVLGQGIEDAEGQRHSMAGLLQVETSFAKRRLHIGYRRARLLADGPLGSAGESIMGHEFHYASVLQAGDEPLVDCRDATGAVVPEAGARRGSVSGTFFHAIDGLKT